MHSLNCFIFILLTGLGCDNSSLYSWEDRLSNLPKIKVGWWWEERTKIQIDFSNTKLQLKAYRLFFFHFKRYHLPPSLEDSLSFILHLKLRFTFQVTLEKYGSSSVYSTHLLRAEWTLIEVTSKSLISLGLKINFKLHLLRKLASVLVFFLSWRFLGSSKTSSNFSHH